jgi:hypothetical protein
LASTHGERLELWNPLHDAATGCRIPVRSFNKTTPAKPYRIMKVHIDQQNRYVFYISGFYISV